jgi:hypothetical protein
MRTKLHIIVGMLTALCNIYAKAQTGIYTSAADYKSNKLTYESKCPEGRHSLHLHDFFGNSPHITVINNGEKHKLLKNELFGFRNCNGEVYRFHHNAEYLVAEAGGIIIYSQTQNIAQSKGFKVVNKYYFSATADGEIFPLTIGNLKNAFHGDDQLYELIDRYLNEGNVTEYDNVHKTFKVNYVLNKAHQ